MLKFYKIFYFRFSWIYNYQLEYFEEGACACLLDKTLETNKFLEFQKRTKLVSSAQIKSFL